MLMEQYCFFMYINTSGDLYQHVECFYILGMYFPEKSKKASMRSHHAQELSDFLEEKNSVSGAQ